MDISLRLVAEKHKTQRTEIKMFSVNQMAVYHTLIEAFNVTRNSSSEQVKEKWVNDSGGTYSLRRMDNMSLKVPNRGRVDCTGFSYHAAKIFNMLPISSRNCTDSKSFKLQVKAWIRETGTILLRFS